MKNILVGQSGGPTAVINSSLYGVVKEAEKNDITVYGMVNGIQGFIQGKYINFADYISRPDFDTLKTTPASFLGSCRFKLPENLEDELYPQIFDKLKELEIDAMIYIGGNDSMDTVDKLSRYAEKIGSSICFIGVPKTIDNDLDITDHTPGFASAAKYIASTVRTIVWDGSVYPYPTVMVVEIMGRNAGWLTASSVLARTEYQKNPKLIYLPEIAFDKDEFIADVREAMKEDKSLIICVSEGIRDARGKLICEYAAESEVDQFGHEHLSGCATVLEAFVKEAVPEAKTRSIELSLPQRCTPWMASATDALEALEAGKTAVQAVMRKETGKMVAFIRSDKEYKIDYRLIPVGEVCNKEKKFPKEWIVNGKDISDEFADYVIPLIQGENQIEYEKGLPKLFKPAYLEK